MLCPSAAQALVGVRAGHVWVERDVQAALWCDVALQLGDVLFVLPGSLIARFTRSEADKPGQMSKSSALRWGWATPAAFEVIEPLVAERIDSGLAENDEILNSMRQRSAYLHQAGRLRGDVVESQGVIQNTVSQPHQHIKRAYV